jgi:asparagine synthase (glutamine-hydrolysing)
MLWVDLMTYLPDDILVKVDRMSMACSLEVRAPLLDHHVVEFMAKIPKNQKHTLFESKVLLRALARRYLPEAILGRPKQGFVVPLAAWLRQELRPWMEDVLHSGACTQRGLFRGKAIDQIMAQHVQGQRDWSQQLWALLVLELWMQQEPGTRGSR